MTQDNSILCLAGAEAGGSDEVLSLIAGVAVTSPVLQGRNPDELVKLLRSREEVISTSLGHGVAIPHCFVNDIEDFVVGVVTLQKGIDFESPDGEPTKIFFFVVAPPAQRNRHVSIMAEISRALRSEETRKTLVAVTDRNVLQETVTKLLTFENRRSDAAFCELRIFVQNDELFEPILEELSAHVDGNVAVEELRSARSYLNRIPLFATLWSSEVDDGVRLIVAVVDKMLVNEIARRIQAVRDEMRITGGVLITAQELLFSAGGIDF